MQRLLRDRRGGPTLELALIAIPVMTIMFYIVTVGLDLYTQNSMDLATLAAARQIRLGNESGTSDSGVRTIICNQMAAWAGSCTTTLQIYVTSGTSFSSLSKATVTSSGLSVTGYSPGVGYSLTAPPSRVLMQVAYPTSNLLPFMPVAPVFLSSAIFENET